jgi:hypothetical protein
VPTAECYDNELPHPPIREPVLAQMNARALFSAAAGFNLLVGIPLLVMYPLSAQLLKLSGDPSVWTHLVAAIVILFGYAYGRVARDPIRFRPYVGLGIIGKLGFVAIIYGHWLAGDASVRLALLVTVDLMFALAFLVYLRRTSETA